MNTTSVAFTATANSICFTDRTRPYCRVWPWAAHAEESAAPPTTTAVNSRQFIDAWNRGDIDAARDHQNFSQEVINVICRYRGNIVGGKRIMKLIGLDLGPNRTPFQNITPEEELSLKKELEEIGFFERCNRF